MAPRRTGSSAPTSSRFASITGTEVTGAGLLATTGIFALIGGTLSGWLSDRVDNRILLSVYYAFRGLSLFYLPFAFDFSVYGLPLFSAVYGLDWIASAPPTVRLLTGVVGTEKIGIMVAWITVIHQIGSAAAAYLGGLLRISFGTYLEAFMLAGALLMVAALMGHCQLGGACLRLWSYPSKPLTARPYA